MFDSRSVTSKSRKMSPRISKQRPSGCSAANRISPSCARYRMIRMRRLVGEVSDGSKSAHTEWLESCPLFRGQDTINAFQRFLVRFQDLRRVGRQLERGFGGCFR